MFVCYIDIYRIRSRNLKRKLERKKKERELHIQRNKLTQVIHLFEKLYILNKNKTKKN